MVSSVLYFILTAAGLGFLIFIHELGHYYMGKKVGMKIEVFSIGFGKPLLVWYRNDVRWQFCVIPFGGYVKFAGEQKEGDKEPYEIPDGFFGKSPWDRIKVAFMGPFVNLLFAFVAFMLLWSFGGREKHFQELTSFIGWVDPQSELYAHGIRPGDRILSYDKQQFMGARDHLYAAMIGDGTVQVRGRKVDYLQQKQEPFEYTVAAYSHPRALDRDVLTLGILEPASYLIYDRYDDGSENPLLKGVPMENSGIQYGDRIISVDAEPIFSVQQLSHLINENRALLTIERGVERFLARVPRIHLEDFSLNQNMQEEIEDWQHEKKIKKNFSDLCFFPYDVTLDCVVQEPLLFIDQEDEKKVFSERIFSSKNAFLQKGDRIVAVDGKHVEKAYDLLEALQEKHLHVIVERDSQRKKGMLWKEVDDEFLASTDLTEVDKIASSIGSEKLIQSSGKFHLLNTVAPIMRKDFFRLQENLDKVLLKQKEELEAIEDQKKRSEALRAWKDHQDQLIIGIPLQDNSVSYNPAPHTLFENVFGDVWRTLKALVSGYLNPKWLSGPIGIVQVIHHGWTIGIKEALFWLGVISLNLGVLNLLPIPVLDGGHICFSLFEIVTKKRLKAKTMERLVLPFMLLLMGFFIFVTYQDILRILSRFFG